MAACATTTRLAQKPNLGNDTGPLVCKVPYTFQLPDPINWKPVQFKVLTPKIMRDIINGKSKDSSDVYIGLTIQDYENLSYNMQDIMKLLQTEKTLILKLREYYSKDSGKTDKNSSGQDNSFFGKLKSSVTNH